MPGYPTQSPEPNLSEVQQETPNNFSLSRCKLALDHHSNELVSGSPFWFHRFRTSSDTKFFPERRVGVTCRRTFASAFFHSLEPSCEAKEDSPRSGQKSQRNAAGLDSGDIRRLIFGVGIRVVRLWSCTTQYIYTDTRVHAYMPSFADRQTYISAYIHIHIYSCIH